MTVAPPVTVERTGRLGTWNEEAPESATTDTSRVSTAAPYAELHAHSHFSFLDGASSPEHMVAEAKRLGIEALALIDHDGFYGAIRFMKAAAQAEIDTVYGAELSLGFPPRGCRARAHQQASNA